MSQVESHPAAAATTRPPLVTRNPTTAPVATSQPVIIDARGRDQILRAALDQLTRRFGGVDRDAQLNEYLVLVGSLVGINAPGAGGEYAYVLLNTEQPVSCAIWPRTICVSRGLIKQMEDESELAGVIGREMSNLVSGRTLKAAGLPGPDEATTRPAAPVLETAEVERRAAKVVELLAGPAAGSELDQAADLEGARIVAAARYAPDGFLRLLTRQTTPGGAGSGAAWERVKALNANVQIIAKAYPQADVRLPARFEGYVAAKKVAP